MGYLLPWGQMSYWGAQVIINLFAAIPFVGPDLALLIRGDYVVGDATLNRFFAFHVIAVPLVLLGLVVAHIIALHEVGSNNPDGVEIKEKKDPETGIPLDGIPFHPYYTVHDMSAWSVFLLLFSAIIFFAPEMRRLFPRVQQLHPGRPAEDAGAHRAGVVLHAVLLDAACGDGRHSSHVLAVLVGAGGGCAGLPRRWLQGHLEVARRWSAAAVVGGAAEDLRRQVLGRGRDGRGGDDPVPAALARPQPGQVDPLPARLEQVVCTALFVVNFCRARLPGHRSRRRRSAPWCRRPARCSTSASSC